MISMTILKVSDFFYNSFFFLFKYHYTCSFLIVDEWVYKFIQFYLDQI